MRSRGILGLKDEILARWWVSWVVMMGAHRPAIKPDRSAGVALPRPFNLMNAHVFASLTLFGSLC